MIFMKKYLLSSFCMMLISSTISLNAQNNVSLEIVHALGEKSFGLNQESQTPEGEALRDDENFTFVSAWEYNGEPADAVLRKEELNYEEIEVKTRSYK